MHEGIESGLSLPKLPFSWSLSWSVMLLAVSLWLLAILSRQCKMMFLGLSRRLIRHKVIVGSVSRCLFIVLQQVLLIGRWQVVFNKLWLQRQLPFVCCEEGSCTSRAYSELLCHCFYWWQHGTQNHDRHVPISATCMDTIKVEFGLQLCTNDHACPWVLSMHLRRAHRTLWSNTVH